jgi:hypothetical protein
MWSGSRCIAANIIDDRCSNKFEMVRGIVAQGKSEVGGLGRSGGAEVGG